MIPLFILALCVVMVGTSFLSGIFGMAGGMILVGILLAIMPVPDAMVLHGVTQMASNGWRALLWMKHVRWRAVLAYVVGCSLALGVWSLARYVPSTPVALLLLGCAPFIVRVVPADLRPNPESMGQGALYGSLCMALILLTGVAGPLIDTYFLGGKLDRREIVATKALCQIVGHGVKFVYFSSVIDQTASLDPTMMTVAILASMIGTTLARRYLEAMSDAQFRNWAMRIIASISGFYVLQGTYLLVAARIVLP